MLDQRIDWLVAARQACKETGYPLSRALASFLGVMSMAHGAMPFTDPGEYRFPCSKVDWFSGIEYLFEISRYSSWGIKVFPPEQDNGCLPLEFEIDYSTYKQGEQYERYLALHRRCLESTRISGSYDAAIAYHAAKAMYEGKVDLVKDTLTRLFVVGGAEFHEAAVLDGPPIILEAGRLLCGVVRNGDPEALDALQKAIRRLESELLAGRKADKPVFGL